MSTHFRPHPRPPTVPSSPVRPSTAHSTIRAVTPSPPDSLQRAFALGLAHASPLVRPRSEHALGAKEMATFARYVLKAEGEGFGSPTKEVEERDGEGLKGGPGFNDAGPELRRGGGRTSPVKARSSSPRKRPTSTPTGVMERRERREGRNQFQTEKGGTGDERIETAQHQQEEEHYQEPPYTPTPIPRSQRYLAYTPLSIGEPHLPPPSCSTPPQLPGSQSGSPSTQPSAHFRPGPVSRKSLPNTSPSTSFPPINNRISVSGHSYITALSTASRNSVFSTPGRDELERKKALVERDQGPFAGATSMKDLEGERRRISGKRDMKGGKEESGKEGKRRARICGLGCVVM